MMNEATAALFGLKTGKDVERQLQSLLYTSGWGSTPPLPFWDLSQEDRSWVAKRFPAEVARVVGYHAGMEIFTADEAMKIISRAGFSAMEYEIRGKASPKQVVAFNRQTCNTEPPTDIPEGSLLIKEGFDWEVTAAQLWPQYASGGVVFNGGLESSNEYDITIAVDPRKWVYLSRSRRSKITFERHEEGEWWFEGRMSLNCLRDLRRVGVEPTIHFGSATIKPAALLEAAKAAETTPI
jgi:hypothetical protein